MCVGRRWNVFDFVIPKSCILVSQRISSFNSVWCVLCATDWSRMFWSTFDIDARQVGEAGQQVPVRQRKEDVRAMVFAVFSFSYDIPWIPISNSSCYWHIDFVGTVRSCSLTRRESSWIGKNMKTRLYQSAGHAYIERKYKTFFEFHIW